MEITALSKGVHVSPRKAALVAKAVRGLRVTEALAKLQFIEKSAAQPLAKTISSAAASAQSKAQIKKENLKIARLEISMGPALKRWRPISRGRAHPYKKRTANIRVILAEAKTQASGRSILAENAAENKKVPENQLKKEKD